MNRDFFLTRWEAEGPGTLRVMRAVPEEKSDYRPDPKSRTAKELVALLTGEAMASLKLIDVGEFDMQPGKLPTVAQLTSGYEQTHAAIAQRVKGLDDAAWGKRANFSFMGHTVFDMPLGQILWALLFDGIHHRGQLSTYLRPMGSKVPSIYGPSADSPGGHEMF
jgi:uncharacterized damage-inducible protein DinB